MNMGGVGEVGGLGSGEYVSGRGCWGLRGERHAGSDSRGRPRALQYSSRPEQSDGWRSEPSAASEREIDSDNTTHYSIERTIEQIKYMNKSYCQALELECKI